MEWSYFTPLEDIEDGGSRTIDYEPEEGYHIASITVDGVPVDINQYPTSYTFANITEDHTIHIVSAPNSVSVPITGMKGILLSLLAGVALLLMSLMAYEKRRARR